MIDRLRSLVGNRSILLQLGAVILLCQVLAQGISVAILFWRFEPPDVLRLTSLQTVEAITAYKLLAQADVRERTVLVDLLGRSTMGVTVAPTADVGAASAVEPGVGHVLKGLAMAAPDLVLRASPVATDGGPATRVALALGDGSSIIFDPRIDAHTITLPRVLVTLQISIAVVSLGLLSLWAVRMLTAPVGRLAASAERFAIDLDPTPMRETGPAELRKLAHAFNTMRERIRTLLESRSRMLAAVSHDLRTPLTRLRLRTEAQDEGDDKDRSLKDIAAMDRMIGQALSYLRDQASPSRRELVELSALVETVCDDFGDTGHRVRFSGHRNLIMECEPDLLVRALSNLIDNAIKFGGSADVDLAMRSASEAVIRIEDEGPGIPDADKFMAFEPFSRGDAARPSKGADGFGLGLAIARQIIERHGGVVTLHDRLPRGLAVQVVLPLKAALGVPADGGRTAPHREMAA